MATDPALFRFNCCPRTPWLCPTGSRERAWADNPPHSYRLCLGNARLPTNMYILHRQVGAYLLAQPCQSWFERYNLPISQAPASATLEMLLRAEDPAKPRLIVITRHNNVTKQPEPIGFFVSRRGYACVRYYLWLMLPLPSDGIYPPHQPLAPP